MKKIKYDKIFALAIVAATAVSLSALIYSMATDRGMVVRVYSKNTHPIKVGAYIPFTVKVTNLSWSPVRVTVIPECQCTATKIEGVMLKPWTSIISPAIVNTHEMYAGLKKRGLMFMYERGKCSWLGKAEFEFKLR